MVEVKPRGELPASMPVVALPDDAWLAPGFIDVQVNGGGDVLFNDTPTAAGINAIAAAHRRYGTTGLLPTLISDTYDKMRAAMAAAQSAAAENPSVLGIHFEGPFLSPEKPGVHDLAMFRAPEARDLELLTSWPAGTVLVTLAPERVPAELHRRAGALRRARIARPFDGDLCADQGGDRRRPHRLHASLQCDASARQPRPRTYRGRARSRRAPTFGMIVDGEHVAPEMLRLALRGAARPMLVTDAMPPVGGRETELHAVRAGDDRARRALHAGRRHARRFGARYGERGAQHRARSRRAADVGAALCLDRAGGVSRARHDARPHWPKASAPTWSPSTRRASRCWIRGSPGRAATQKARH